MNNLEYLNQISRNSSKKSKSGASDLSLIFKILGGGVIVFILLLIIGLIIGGNSSTNSKNTTEQLYLRTDNLNATVTLYNKSLKSSNLRAIGLSLGTTLTEASGKLKNYLNSTEDSTDDSSKADTDDKLTDEETAHIETVNNTLANAKLNGILDRIYANQIQLQVSLLLSLISQDLATTNPDDTDLTTILNSYQSNLTIIEKSLSEYSSPSD